MSGDVSSAGWKLWRDTGQDRNLQEQKGIVLATAGLRACGSILAYFLRPHNHILYFDIRIYIFGFRSQAASWSSHTQQSSLSESVGAPHFGRSRKLACYCSRQELCFKCIGGSCVKGPLGPPRPPPASDVWNIMKYLMFGPTPWPFPREKENVAWAAATNSNTPPGEGIEQYRTKQNSANTAPT